MTQRFAIYYAPRPGALLALFGAEWLGRDAEAEAVTPRPDVQKIPGFGIIGHSEISEADWRAAISTAARYGFHGTLKPPFQLHAGTDEDSLYAAVEELAKGAPPVLLGRLKLDELDRFLALTPEKTGGVRALAARCVENLDMFRAPPSAGELARRRAHHLTPAQDALLERWGYPYVMDEFRFHLTLTGRLNKATRKKFQRELTARIAGFIDDPVTITDLSVFVQDEANAEFREVRRFPLSG